MYWNRTVYYRIMQFIVMWEFPQIRGCIGIMEKKMEAMPKSEVLVLPSYEPGEGISDYSSIGYWCACMALRIVVQMLPLVFLEKKILSCPDPVSMLSRFGSKAPDALNPKFLGAPAQVQESGNVSS